MLAHGQQVSAMVDEMDLGAGLGEPAPQMRPSAIMLATGQDARRDG
jgi:hypothetical protein